MRVQGSTTATVDIGYPSARSARKALAVLCGVCVFTSMDVALTGLLLEPLKKDLALSDLQIGLVQGTAFGLGMGLSAIPNGLAIDRTNRMRLLTVGMLGWTATMVGAASVSSFFILFLCEMMLGFLTSLLTSAAVSLIGDFVHPEQRSMATSLLAVSQTCGQALAFFAGGVLVDTLARQASVGTALTSQIAPWRITYLLFAGLGGLVLPFLAMTREPKRMEVREAPGSIRRGFIELFRYRAFLIPLFAAAACSIMASSAVLTWIAPALMRLYGQTSTQVGAWLGAVSLPSGIVGSLLAGKFSEAARRSNRGILLPAAIASLVAAPCALLAMTPSVGWVVSLLGIVIVAVAIVGVNVSVTIILYIPNELRGLSQGLYLLTSYGVGRALAPSSVAETTKLLGSDTGLGSAIALVSIPSCLVAAFLFMRASAAARRLSGERKSTVQLVD